MTAILVLGGTAEAVNIARRLSGEAGLDVIYSLAGRTRTPVLPDCALRTGGFGGAEGLAAFVGENNIRAIVDATHPFAVRMADNARRAAERAGTPLFKFLRPAWEEPADAPWLHAATPKDAADIVDGRFDRVFLSSGLGDIGDFAHLSAVWFLVRSVDATDSISVLVHHHHIASRGPFDAASEAALLRRWRIEALVTKNSGGEATRAKLDAAASLGIPVIMIDRPAPPPELHCADVGALLAAVTGFLATAGG